MHTVPLGRKLRRPIWWDLGVQLPRRLSEKVTSEPNNSSQDGRGGADYHGDGNKGRGE